MVTTRDAGARGAANTPTATAAMIGGRLVITMRREHLHAA
jgi:hypothetical protein